MVVYKTATTRQQQMNNNNNMSNNNGSQNCGCHQWGNLHFAQIAIRKTLCTLYTSHSTNSGLST